MNSTSSLKFKGSLGETIAQKYLQSKGYEILCRNWTCHWGEIDLIAKKDKKLVFVEVKFRTSSNFGAGWNSVGYFKKRHLYRSIQMFLSGHKQFLAFGLQVDVLSITSKKESEYFLEHFENVGL